MAYKINSNTVIDGSNTSITGYFLSGVGLTVKNDSGEIHVQDTSPMVGTVAGYTAGGFDPPNSNVIDKFPFATDTNATDVGDLTVARVNLSGQSSTISGYASGGQPSPGPYRNIIEKFSFSINNNSTDVGDLTQSRSGAAGQSSITHGYTSGGIFSPPPSTLNTIDRFPFTSDSNASDVGDITVTNGRYACSGQSSSINGYTSGGRSFPADVILNTIDKFPFATNTNATDVGDLTIINFFTSGQSSKTHGYVSGGLDPTASPINLALINKFPFASDTNASSIGNLTLARRGSAGQSSVVSGYTSGGTEPPTASTNTIDKFPFATDTNATDVGDLTVARRALPAGVQD